MLPYADSLSFAVLLVPVLATVALGLLGRASWRWALFVSVALLVVQYGAYQESPPRFPGRQLLVLAGYVALQWLIARTFLSIRARGPSRGAFWAAILAALLPLIVVKVAPGTPAASWVYFLGLSYVTFRSLDVVIGVHDRVITALPAAQYLLFISFFPTISSGPIDRFRRFVGDCTRIRTRAEFLADLDQAVHRLFRGLLYKFVFAVLVREYWMDPVASQRGALAVASYMYAYSAYLFFDFAGYSAFAIALSYVLGIRTPENFARPYLAVNITDFWNRWHISLSTWFRDHVYMRFLLLATRRKWFKDRLLASTTAFFVTFGLMGLWHGTHPRYIIYGLYHATLLSGHGYWAGWRRQRPSFGQGSLWRFAAVLITFHAVAFGFLIFSGRLG